MFGGHVTPVDHIYLKSYDHIPDENAEINIDIYSPADGTITGIQYMDSSKDVGSDHSMIYDYWLYIS